MTKLLDQAIAEVQKLTDEEQDRIAAELMATVTESIRDRGLQLSDEQLAEVRRRRAEPNPRTLTLEEAIARLRRLHA